ncbi:hypothetical protein MMC07_008920 [Pseudocyphellaria aurata]|nr:hypothetical protein [Pseudocyphellaria aurata]
MAFQKHQKMFRQLLDQPHSNRLIIVGAGIVGSSLANFLSDGEKSLQIVLLDRSLDPLTGSTGHAPGFVGQLNQNAHLTKLAILSVKEYSMIQGAYDKVGGLEIATSEEEARKLLQRLSLAKAANLNAEIISAEAAAARAPQYVRAETAKAALHFPDDGTARADIITAAYRDRAIANGVVVLEATVEAMEVDEKDGPRITGLSTNLGSLPCSRIIFATGIWTSRIVSPSVSKAIVSVAHPYIHGCPRAALPGCRSPFVRYPCSRVYMRDHGSHDGLGSYDHAAVVIDKPGTTGIEPWPGKSQSNKDEINENNEFDEALHRAYALLPNKSLFDGGTAFNGVFAVTPDNLPLAGRVDGVQGLWVTAAVWVTHAAGTARLVAELVKRDARFGVGGFGSEGESEIGDRVQGGERKWDEQLEEDEEMMRALDPNRFKGEKEGVLREMALHWYNDVGKYLS